MNEDRSQVEVYLNSHGIKMTNSTLREDETPQDYHKKTTSPTNTRWQEDESIEDYANRCGKSVAQVSREIAARNQ